MREGAARSLHTNRMTNEVPSVVGIPPLPQHAEEVVHYQDTPMIAHIGALIAKGDSKFSSVESREG